MRRSVAAEVAQHLSHLPIVNLDEIALPTSGFSVATSSVCARRFARGDQCRKHYEKVRALEMPNDRLVQCPFGLASLPMAVGQAKLALTGFIPYPRIGGGAEKMLAKSHPEVKVSVSLVRAAADALRSAQKHLDELERRSIQQQSLALHEIRKLNRTVKQTAERLCRAESPSDPDRAPREVLNIWKASELMSKQFDVIELLANESLASLPLNTICEPYRVFDKCAHIYRLHTGWKNLVLWAPPSFSPKMKACDKTFPILASVLVENAIKYAVPDSEIRVEVYPMAADTRRIVVKVTNSAEPRSPLTHDILKKGVRGAYDGDGSGNGLYVASLVARQHESDLALETVPSTQKGRTDVSFKVVFRRADK